MPDKDGYPTETELKLVKTLGHHTTPVSELIEHIQSIWHWEDYVQLRKGVSSLGRKVQILELHTGGWSGNENIIDVLAETDFWELWWEESRRGGHYKFEIPVAKMKVKRDVEPLEEKEMLRRRRRPNDRDTNPISG